MTKAALRKTIREAQNALNEIEQSEWERRSKRLIGRCFKYSNSYSGDRPRWWLYCRVVGLSDCGLMMFQFQTDCDGRINIEPSHGHYRHLSEDYLPISAGEFSEAWQALCDRIAGFTP